jgi:hypothetical protein
MKEWVVTDINGNTLVNKFSAGGRKAATTIWLALLKAMGYWNDKALDEYVVHSSDGKNFFYHRVHGRSWVGELVCKHEIHPTTTCDLCMNERRVMKEKLEHTVLAVLVRFRQTKQARKSSSGEWMTVQDIERWTNLSKPQIKRTLRSLESFGKIEYDTGPIARARLGR